MKDYSRSKTSDFKQQVKLLEFLKNEKALGEMILIHGLIKIDFHDINVDELLDNHDT